jgi:hypothetical protein
MAQTPELQQNPPVAENTSGGTPPPDTGWRFDRKEQYLRYGIPGAPEGGWFDASKERKGVAWATGGNGFTGDINDKGLNMFAGGDLNLRAQADWSKKSGDLSLNYLDRKYLNLHGEGSGLDNYKLALQSPLSLGEDRTLTPELRHEVKDGKATDVAGLNYQNGPLTQGLDFNLTDPSISNRLSLKTPTDQINFRHVMGDNPGASLDFKHTNPDTSVLSGGASNLDGIDKLKLGWESPFAGGRWNASGGYTHDPKKGEAYDLGLGWKSPEGGFGMSGHYGGADDQKYRLDWNRVLGKDQSVGGNLEYATNAQGEKLSSGYSYQPSKEMKLGGELYALRNHDGSSAMGGGANLDYRSAGFGGSLKLDGAEGTRPGADQLNLRGDALGRIAPNWYVGGQGNLNLKEGQDPNWFLGGNVTYQPKDWLALSAAAGMGNNGPAARLQADIFRSQPKGAGELLDARRKGGTLSLFAEGSMGGAASPFNGSFGEAKDMVPLGGQPGGPQFQLGLGYRW